MQFNFSQFIQSILSLLKKLISIYILIVRYYFLCWYYIYFYMCKTLLGNFIFICSVFIFFRPGTFNNIYVYGFSVFYVIVSITSGFLVYFFVQFANNAKFLRDHIGVDNFTHYVGNSTGSIARTTAIAFGFTTFAAAGLSAGVDYLHHEHQDVLMERRLIRIQQIVDENIKAGMPVDRAYEMAIKTVQAAQGQPVNNTVPFADTSRSLNIGDNFNRFLGGSRRS